jgi:hypothetical protein
MQRRIVTIRGMSSLPPRPVQLLDYAFIPRSRPGLVTTIGVLSVIFGSLGILSHGCGTIYSTLFFVAVVAVPSPAANPAPAGVSADDVEASRDDPATQPAMTAAKVDAIVSAIQQKAGRPLNEQQIATIRSTLASSDQQLVDASSDAGMFVSSVQVQPDGTAQIQFGRGGLLVVGPRGQTLMNYTGRNPFLGPLGGSPAPFVAGIAMAAVNLGLAIYLLVIGILVLRDSPRGGWLHWVYVWLRIPTAIASGLAVAWMMGSLARGFAPGAAVPIPAATEVFNRFAVGLAVVGCLYPLALIFVLRTGSVRAYYSTGATG